MTLNIVVRSSAEKDITEAIEWYEKQLPGLGSRFLNDIDQTIISIKDNPEIYRKVYKDFRRALLNKFPFGIYYLLESDKVVIFAVYHEKRNPKSWKKRV